MTGSRGQEEGCVFFTLTVASSLGLWLHCKEWRQGGHPGLNRDRWQLLWAKRVGGVGTGFWRHQDVGKRKEFTVTWGFLVWDSAIPLWL